MADYTITRYLKLKIADDLSSDAKYNLQKIDSLGATTITDALDNLQLRSRGNVVIEAESPDVGGSGSNGTISIGTSSSLASVETYTSTFNLRSALSLLVDTSGLNKLSLSVAPTHTGSAAITLSAAGNASLTIPPSASAQAVVTDIATQTLTNKSIDGASNTLVNIDYSSLILTNAITNADISASAAIADSKLATIATAGKVSNSATTATAANTASAIVARDGSGSFAAGTITATFIGALTGNVTGNLTGNVTGNVSGTASNVTGIVAIANGGTNASTAAQARTNLGVIASNILPSYTGNALATLRVNSTETDIEWVTGAGQGTVTGVTATSPLVISNNPNLDPNISLPQATALTNGYLSSADWSTFNAKESAIASGTTGQYWRGDKSWQTLDKSAVGLSNVDNTSDANKPISSATQTALNSKYDASNPSAFVNAAGAKTAAVVNSTAGTETDQAPSVAAVKAYVSAQGGGALSYTWSTADGVTKSITHNLSKVTISVSIYDENGEDVLVDTVDRVDTNTVALTASVAPTGNWTVVIRP